MSVQCYPQLMLSRTPALALVMVVAFVACASDGRVGATPSCGLEGHLSPRGNCIYPTFNPACATSLRYASGGCVPATVYDLLDTDQSFTDPRRELVSTREGCTISAGRWGAGPGGR
jgi:hypothetical protein